MRVETVVIVYRVPTEMTEFPVVRDKIRSRELMITTPYLEVWIMTSSMVALRMICSTEEMEMTL